MKKLRLIALITAFIEVICIVIFHHHINLSLGSILFIGFLVSPIFDAFNHNRRYRHIKYDGNNEEFVQTKPTESLGSLLWDGLNITIFLLPLVLPFIFFFTNKVKLCFFAIELFLILGSIIVYMLILIKKDRDAQKKIEEEKLKEQRKKEEMGDWK